jgi:hypothetical protein
VKSASALFFRKSTASFVRDRVGVTNAELAELSKRTFATQNTAMRVVEQAALDANAKAFEAINEMTPIPELQGPVVVVLGKLAGQGNEAGFSYAGPGLFVDSLGTAADRGDERAIEALVAVTKSDERRALWFLAAKNLNQAAENGNVAAIDALINLGASATNQSVRNVVVEGLRKAAANQNLC